MAQLEITETIESVALSDVQLVTIARNPEGGLFVDCSFHVRTSEGELWKGDTYRVTVPAQQISDLVDIINNYVIPAVNSELGFA